MLYLSGLTSLLNPLHIAVLIEDVHASVATEMGAFRLFCYSVSYKSLAPQLIFKAQVVGTPINLVTIRKHNKVIH